MCDTPILDTDFIQYCRNEIIYYSVGRDKQYENPGKTFLFDFFFFLLYSKYLT